MDEIIKIEKVYLVSGSNIDPKVFKTRKEAKLFFRELSIAQKIASEICVIPGIVVNNECLGVDWKSKDFVVSERESRSEESQDKKVETVAKWTSKKTEKEDDIVRIAEKRAQVRLLDLDFCYKVIANALERKGVSATEMDGVSIAVSKYSRDNFPYAYLEKSRNPRYTKAIFKFSKGRPVLVNAYREIASDSNSHYYFTC